MVYKLYVCFEVEDKEMRLCVELSALIVLIHSRARENSRNSIWRSFLGTKKTPREFWIKESVRGFISLELCSIYSGNHWGTTLLVFDSIDVASTLAKLPHLFEAKDTAFGEYSMKTLLASPVKFRWTIETIGSHYKLFWTSVMRKPTLK